MSLVHSSGPSRPFRRQDSVQQPPIAGVHTSPLQAPGGGMPSPAHAASLYPPVHPQNGLGTGYSTTCWPMAAASGRPQHLPPRAHPTLSPVNPAASASWDPLAALMLAVKQQAQHGDRSPERARESHGRAAQAAAAVASALVSAAKRRATAGARGLGMAAEPAQPDQPHAHWYSACQSSPSTSISPCASLLTSSCGSAGFSSVKVKAVASSGAGGGATGAGALEELPPISQPGRRGRRKGSKDGWNAAGTLAGLEEARVGLLHGVHTATLNKYMPAKEKVRRTRTLLAHMSSDEKTERRKERARKYSQDLRRRQLESIQELLIEARRLNVFQLLVQESADPLLVLAPLTMGEEASPAAGTVLFANAAAEALLLGRRPRGTGEMERAGGSEELLGRGLLGFVRTGDRAEVEAALRRVGGGRDHVQRVRCRLAPEGVEKAVVVELLLREGAQGVVCNGRVL